MKQIQGSEKVKIKEYVHAWSEFLFVSILAICNFFPQISHFLLFYVSTWLARCGKSLCSLARYRVKDSKNSLSALSPCIILYIILLPEKFLPFDWLRAEAFQLNLKYLHVKITVAMVTQNHQIISSHELRKNGGKILKSGDSRTKRKFGKPKY